MPNRALEALCPNCFSLVPDSERCGRCGSPRLIVHPELAALGIAHVDCDAFYAAIEKRDDPSLTDQPVIVGGGRRGVVAAACYVARTYGVRSAMPMFRALKACPHAVVISPDMAKYAGVGREVQARMLALTPAVEPLSIDEAFMDLTGTDRLHGAPAAVVLARFQAEVEREIGISVSIGLSHNKFLAKIASDLDKPRGFALIGRAETKGFLAAQPISLIWGVGKIMQERLARDGLRLMGDLQKVDERRLAEHYGAAGLRLARLARGEDDRSVTPQHRAKTISAETTFDADIAAREELLPILRRMSERVSARLKSQGLAGSLLILKLKTADFRLRTRNARLDSPTDLADRIYRGSRDLLVRELDGTRYRLLGVGVAALGPGNAADAADLIEPEMAKRASAERALDKVRARFGQDGLSLGLTFAAKRPES